MAKKTKFIKEGGPVEVIPVMEGLMNCGYTIDIFAPNADEPYRSQSGNIENVKTLILEPAATIEQNTRVSCVFKYRAGNNALVGTPFKLKLSAHQDGIELELCDEINGVLPKVVTEDQLMLRLVIKL